MIDEAESQKVPEGFVLVPIETIEKVRVGLRDWELPDNRYAALDAINSDFAAAPKPEKAETLQGLSETSEELGGYTPDFCDANCTWRDHHPECERADLDADQWRAEPHGEPIGAVAWWAHLPEGPAQ